MSSEKFEVGEVAILCNCPPGSYGFALNLNGTEVIIERGLEFYSKEVGDVYLITIGGVPNPNSSTDRRWAVSPQCLRKKPRMKREIDHVVRWEDCDWQP